MKFQLFILILFFSFVGCSAVDESGEGVKSVTATTKTPYFLITSENISFFAPDEVQTLNFVLMNPYTDENSTNEIIFSSTSLVSVDSTNLVTTQSLSSQINYSVNATALSSGSEILTIYLNDTNSTITGEFNLTIGEESEISIQNITSEISLEFEEEQTLTFEVTNNTNLADENIYLTFSQSDLVDLNETILSPVSSEDSVNTYQAIISGTTADSTLDLTVTAILTNDTNLTKSYTVSVDSEPVPVISISGYTTSTSIDLDYEENLTLAIQVTEPSLFDSDITVSFSDNGIVEADSTTLSPKTESTLANTYSLSLTGATADSTTEMTLSVTLSDNSETVSKTYEINVAEEIISIIGVSTTITDPIELTQEEQKTLTLFINNPSSSTSTITAETESLDIVSLSNTTLSKTYTSGTYQYYSLIVTASDSLEGNETVTIYTTDDSSIYYDLNFSVTAESNETQEINETTEEDENISSISLAPDVTTPIYLTPDQQKSLYILFENPYSDTSIVTAEISDTSIATISESELSQVTYTSSTSDTNYYLLTLFGVAEGSTTVTITSDENSSLYLSFTVIVEEETSLTAINSECSFGLNTDNYSIIQSSLGNLVKTDEIELQSHLMGDTEEDTKVSIIYETQSSYTDIGDRTTYFLKDSSSNLIASMVYSVELESTVFYLKYKNIYGNTVCLSDNYFPVLDEDTNTFTEGSVTDPDELPDPTS